MPGMGVISGGKQFRGWKWGVAGTTKMETAVRKRRRARFCPIDQVKAKSAKTFLTSDPLYFRLFWHRFFRNYWTSRAPEHRTQASEDQQQFVVFCRCIEYNGLDSDEPNTWWPAIFRGQALQPLSSMHLPVLAAMELNKHRWWRQTVRLLARHVFLRQSLRGLIVRDNLQGKPGLSARVVPRLDVLLCRLVIDPPRVQRWGVCRITLFLLPRGRRGRRMLLPSVHKLQGKGAARVLLLFFLRIAWVQAVPCGLARMVEKPRKERGRAPPHADDSMTCAKRIVCMVELHEILPPTLAMIVQFGQIISTKKEKKTIIII